MYMYCSCTVVLESTKLVHLVLSSTCTAVPGTSAGVLNLVPGRPGTKFSADLGAQNCQIWGTVFPYMPESTPKLHPHKRAPPPWFPAVQGHPEPGFQFAGSYSGVAHRYSRGTAVPGSNTRFIAVFEWMLKMPTRLVRDR